MGRFTFGDTAVHQMSAFVYVHRFLVHCMHDIRMFVVYFGVLDQTAV